MSALVAALGALGGVLVGYWIAGGFRRAPFAPLPYIADMTPPTLAELREVDHD